MRRRALPFLASTACLVALVGCGGSGGGHSFSESQWLTTEAETVLFRGGFVSLTVGANAVTTNTKVILVNPPTTPVPFSTAILSDTEYEFTPLTLASTGTIGISYDPADIPAGYSEANLQVVRLSNGAWVTQTATADTNNNRFTFTTTTLGVYAIRIANFVG